MPELLKIAREAKAWACYDCGKCTATCPLTRAGARYSPRKHVLATNLGNEDELTGNGTVFECLTCGMCDERCPVGVAYTGMVLGLRELAFREGKEVECPHGGALQSAMRIMAQGKLRQDRLAWLTAGMDTEPEKGEVFYWAGCTPFYDAFFPEFGLATTDGSAAAVRVLNKLGIKPVVSAEERCCGHDLLWNGDRANLERLARHNVKLIKESGARTVIVSCAECLRTLKVDYGKFFKGDMPEIRHVTEYVAERLDGITFKANGTRRVTFQDPCRLGRHLKIYDPPVAILDKLPNVDFRDMPGSGRNAVCCAGGAWSNCDRFAKKIQVGRLREARATGAEELVTACPKCQVHLRCAMKDPNLGDEIYIRMRDIAELIDEAMA